MERKVEEVSFVFVDLLYFSFDLSLVRYTYVVEFIVFLLLKVLRVITPVS
jgi:hypothetical protein